MGRINLSYQNAGERLKRKLASNLASESDHDTSLMIHAAPVSARNERKRDVAFVLNETLKTPEFSSESMMQIQWQKPTPLSPDEALAYLLENTLTIQQYISARILNKSHNSDIYPPYNEVIKAKLQCRPEGIEVMENTAQVLLQNLLDHTSQRLIKLQSDVFNQFPDILHAQI